MRQRQRSVSWPGRRQPADATGGRGRWALVVVAMLCCLVLLVAWTLGRREDARPVDREAAALAPSGGALLGAWVKSLEGQSVQARRQAVTRLEGQLGRRLDIDHHFYQWDRSFPTEAEVWDLDQGRIPLISWNGARTDLIAAGAFDDLIRERAAGLRALGRPLLLRWFWEMDAARDRWQTVSPASYVAAWRHIHDLFAATGARNVAWVWCPNALAFSTGDAAAWYPGDAYVDWICADGYNWAPGRPNDRWRTFEEIFADFYRWGAARGKPLMVAEFGVQERGPGEKAEWLRAVGATLKRQFPRIAAVVYFSSDKEYDWWLDSSPAALAAFRELAADAYFNRRG
jgi:Glycosyl hydrolase family 26